MAVEPISLLGLAVKAEVGTTVLMWYTLLTLTKRREVLRDHQLGVEFGELHRPPQRLTVMIDRLDSISDTFRGIRVREDERQTRPITLDYCSNPRTLRLLVS